MKAREETKVLLFKCLYLAPFCHVMLTAALQLQLMLLGNLLKIQTKMPMERLLEGIENNSKFKII
jgi:hypothetical protein